MIDHNEDFLSAVKSIMEGKEPPKKDKKPDAEETLAKVKKDLGVKDDGKEEGKKKDGEDAGSKKGNEDGSTIEKDHPDHPESAGSPDEVPADTTDQEAEKATKKEPKKPDLSKDPFKGDDPKGGGIDPKGGDSEGAPEPKGKGEKSVNPSSDKGEDSESESSAPKKKAKGADKTGDSDEDAEDSNDADGASIGKKVGKEDPDGDEEESDNPAGPSGEVIDGSSSTAVNLTPKIKDETISERKMTIVEKVQAARLKTRALMEAKEELVKIEALLDEGFDGSIPGEWFKDEQGDYHVAVMFEDGLKDYVIEKHIGFEKLKGELSAEGGVKDPGGLANYIGRKKYGKKAMAKASADKKAL